MSDLSPDPVQQAFNRRWVWTASFAFAGILWMTGPPMAIGPLVFIALVPLFTLVNLSPTQTWKRPLYVASLIYWLLSLQGLRHAHPLMFAPWILLSGYLAIYPVLFVGLLRRWHRVSEARSRSHLPICLIAAGVWVGLEWIRNHFATGISVLMLGHALVDLPVFIQIADLFGTYGISFVIVCINVAMHEVLTHFVLRQPHQTIGRWKPAIAVALILLVATLGYGNVAMNATTEPSQSAILLIGGNEVTVYEQNVVREREIYSAYARQTIQAVASFEQRIDAVVWPESMLSGGMSWMAEGTNMRVPDFMQDPSLPPLTTDELRVGIESSQQTFQVRARELQAAMAVPNADIKRTVPAIIGGCGIVRYGEQPRQYSGVVWVDSLSRVAGTYTKNHLVLFGETIPLVRSLPIIRDFVPPGLGLDAGEDPALFSLPNIKLMPNLCIETAVERIAVDQMRQLRQDQILPDAIVTLTNDVWFRNSAVVEHHLRCAQLVAVGCRRPILSAANGGPTAWIDSTGRVVKRLSPGETGAILAQPRLDDRVSLYVRIGAWPAAAFGWIVVAVLGWIGVSKLLPLNRT